MYSDQIQVLTFRRSVLVWALPVTSLAALPSLPSPQYGRQKPGGSVFSGRVCRSTIVLPYVPPMQCTSRIIQAVATP
ncbi:hypothetical protein BOTBODRAFT_519345 [Botryobasidium botryosum FD-172 SS1]|uniref:Secreted protein n=1 Tax=Botryobasidium botryosum (strain FD-172 SS1) TaxID=930990 RepID=A0A067N3K6_BOTB1|nr:hypothetical protein BOTBODRAFT_519345 [Botryobasidium botryosum FD-172 SS1]